MRIRALATALAAVVAAAGAAASSLPGLVPGVAEAAVVREVSLRHLVRVADTVVEGTPEESTSVWETVPGAGRRIVTYTRVTVGERVYGDAGPSVWVRTLGGVVGDIGQRVDGEAALVLGERSVLFLRAAPDGTHGIVEMAQGHYIVTRDGAAERLRPSPRVGSFAGKRGPAPSARDALEGREVSEARSIIRVERKAAER